MSGGDPAGGRADEAGGPVEEYLDRVFDLLAGAGRTGRRALTEIEDHLRDSVAEQVAAGRGRTEAERRAVERFGPAETVARGLLAANAAGAGALLRRMLAALWLVGGVGLVVVGVSGPAVWLVGTVFGRDLVAGDPPGLRLGAARCADLAEYHPHAPNCWAASVAHHFDEEVRNRVAVGVLGLLVLAAFWLVRRGRPRWLARFRGLTVPPPTPVVASGAAAVFGAAAVLLTGLGLDRLAVGQRSGAGTTLVSGLAAAVAFLAFLPPVVRELRLRAH